MGEPWERAAARVGGPGVVEALAELPASELTALLVEVSARRQRRLTAAAVARRFGEDRFVRPSSVDQRTVAAFDANLLARIPAEYEAVELGPVAPLGTCSALGLVHPNQVLPTFRSTEVVADCTNVLALECARRPAGARLCTSHRLLRTALPTEPGHTQHFRALTLVRSGRDPGGRAFAVESVAEHVRIWVDLLTHLPDGWHAEPVALVVAHDAAHAEVVGQLTERVGLPVRVDEQRFANSRYYQGIAYKLEVRAPSGLVLPLGDGGFVDWLVRITNDRKRRLLIGAIGTELLVKLFRVG